MAEKVEIKANDNPPSTTPRALENAMEMSERERQQIERYLVALGVNPGAQDGVFDENTRSAIRTWQWTEELPPTGYLTVDQLQLLMTHARTTATQFDNAPTPASFQPVSQNLGRAKSGDWPNFKAFALRKGKATTRRIETRKKPTTSRKDEDLFDEAIREIGTNLENGVSALRNNPEIEALLRDQRRPRPKEQ